MGFACVAEADGGQRRRYHARMQNLLLNLRHVPDDEAAEVRALLEAERVDWYETAPNRWGISAGALWVRDETEAARARALLVDYQAARRERARAAHAEALREGTAPTWRSQWREQPLRVLVVLAAIAGIIALSLWPLLLVGR